MNAATLSVTERATAQDPACPASERIRQLLNRAREGEFGPRTEARAELSQQALHENRKEPRKIQIARLLEAALREPDRYRHLVVRVAGYSDFFVRLSRFPELQTYIIEREKHARV